jgi:hypothetical protein
MCMCMAVRSSRDAHALSAAGRLQRVDTLGHTWASAYRDATYLNLATSANPRMVAVLGERRLRTA